MNEDVKLAEAEYFLRGVTREATRNPTSTRHELSAFLTAARSALQFALTEAVAQGSQSWYDSAIAAADPVVDFLRVTRNLNVHERPFSMRTDITIGLRSGAVGYSSTGTIVVTTDANGEVQMQWPEIPPALPPQQNNMMSMEPPTTTYRYQFKDWAGPEDALELCARYLAEVKRIIADGRARCILTLPETSV